MTKFLGIILASIFSVILIVQVEQVSAQVGDTPITGPITSPITSPLTSPTNSPTPTLINTLTSTPTTTVTVTATATPTVTPTVSPSATMSPTATPMPSATPTPLPANVVRLGGLNLDGYCAEVGNNWDTVINGEWYCGNGSAKIDMTAACQWQNSRTDTFAYQDRTGDAYSWSCYAATANVTPSVTVTPTVTPTVSITVTPTAVMTVTPTPSESVTATPSITSEVTPTPSVSGEPTVTPTSATNHNGFPFHGLSLRALFTAIRFFENTSHVSRQKDTNALQSETCTTHDRPVRSVSHDGDTHKHMILSKRSN